MKLLLLLASFTISVFAEHWAVIVAGSSGFYNYRHQADACHAYHVVSQYGIPDERIIVMMYDDIAESRNNPVKGKIFNKPTASGVPGKDVYEGCKKDYTGSAVTPANFVKVLTGDTSAPGPVLKTTSSDNVFINFVDHGGTGIIAFPHGTMSSEMLNDALLTMNKKAMYNKLVFYMEACESGSMFQNILPPNLNIYATTASNARESSWGTYCPPDDVVNGVKMNTCLGDLYSVNWMEDAEKAGDTESLEKQYMLIKTKTSKSHVMQYGDMNFTSEAIGDFMGNLSDTNNVNVKNTPSRPSVNVDSRDIPLHLAYYNYVRAEKSDFVARQERAAALIKEIRSRQKIDYLFHDLVKKVSQSSKMFFAAAKMPSKCPCCDKVHEAMYRYCGGYNDYSLQYSRVVVNLCSAASPDNIIRHLKSLC